MTTSKTAHSATDSNTGNNADSDSTLESRLRALVTRNTMGLSPKALALAYADWSMHLTVSPMRQMQLLQKAFAMPGQVAAALLTTADSEAAVPAQADHRFDGSGWNQWPFTVLKETFKASDAWWQDAAQADGMSKHHQQMVGFYTRQAMDALSPSNYPLTNPEVLRLGVATFGQSWLNGYKSYMKDLAQQQRARLRTDPSAAAPQDYVVGKDVAVSPGKVVFRNHLIELIQYNPTTDTVYPEPLLIVPSCIMKYYILDLSPSNSMVRYLVGRGYTVFMVSWRNPDATDRELGLDDYLRMGVLDAMAAIRAETHTPRIHALGYCLGGTFLSIAAARLAHGDGTAAERARYPELASVSLLAALTDFTEPGEMGVFIDEDQVKALRAQMARTGFLSGKQMAGSFQFLNSRDLIWSRNTRRYLLGQDEVGNDMMAWNADVTRLPARMHSEYLDHLFLHNALAAGNLQCAGVAVALMDIKAPMLVVGTVRDHVCPWASVYKIHQLTDTHTTFILAAGGHNAGIVSEPGHPNRSYQLASVEPGHGWTEPTTWQATAPKHEGSWWDALDQWLQTRSSKRVAAKAIPPKASLCDAPGNYAMVRYAD
ncbi:MAG: alpha/beta fold hydrolase [Rhodoferax sp.]